MKLSSKPHIGEPLAAGEPGERLSMKGVAAQRRPRCFFAVRMRAERVGRVAVQQEEEVHLLGSGVELPGDLESHQPAEAEAAQVIRPRGLNGADLRNEASGP